MYDSGKNLIHRGGKVQNAPEIPLPPIVGNPEQNPDNIPAVPLPPIVGNPEQNPDNIPAVPLPPIVGNPEQNPDNIPVVPLPPVIGNPEQNPDNIPALPLPPVIGNPEQNPDNIPVAPLPPIVGNPEQNPDNIPVVPLPPFVGNPGQSNCCGMVRFLHAVPGYGPLNVIVGLRVAAANLAYTDVSGYSRVLDGFYPVTISSSRNPATILFRGRIPFNAGEMLTMAIVKSVNGLDLVRISDQPCKNMPAGRGCVRAVNLIFNSPPMDVIFTDGRVAFSDVRFREATSYKQARPGEYDFYVAQTPYVAVTARDEEGVLNNQPVVITNFYLPGYGRVTPLVSSYVTVESGGVYTIYLFGDWDESNEVRVKVIS